MVPTPASQASCEAPEKTEVNTLLNRKALTAEGGCRGAYPRMTNECSVFHVFFFFPTKEGRCHSLAYLSVWEAPWCQLHVWVPGLWMLGICWGPFLEGPMKPPGKDSSCVIPPEAPESTRRTWGGRDHLLEWPGLALNPLSS